MYCETLRLKDRFPFLGENDCDPSLELYIPENMKELNRAEEKRPSVLLLPGGGYRFVSRREAEPVAMHLLTLGFNVFILTYSVAPNAFPTQLREVAAAMELIWENSDKWYCDPEKIAIMGFSAGGHLAAHYTNRYDCPHVRATFPDSKPVAASVLAYPVITADPAYCHSGSFEKLNGGTYPERQEEIDFFSCDKMVSERTPPSFLWHCTGDKVVPVQNSILYAKALADNKVPFRMEIFPAGKHGMSTCDYVTADQLLPEAAVVREWLTVLKQWLAEVLK
ncbi:MAG: alpha/beta hydrolase [Oscillospiraceae bacterium]|nr:alpha/beta hydrolase [Oscillospiraceae bacterium]